MAYYAGSANTLNDIGSALLAALGSNGWSEEANGFLSSEGVWVSVTVTGDGLTSPSRLVASVGNSPTDLAPVAPKLGPLGNQVVSQPPVPWSWPVSYRIFILSEPLEVYLVVQYGSFIQQISFGKSPSVGNLGTGVWAHGTIPEGSTGVSLRENALNMTPTGVTLSNRSSPPHYMSPIPFFVDGQTVGVPQSSSMHRDVEGGSPGWSDINVALKNEVGGVSSGVVLGPLMSCLPNAWNAETVLLPCQVFQRRLENKVSLIGELQHLRILRNDYIADGEVISLGQDRWIVFSAYRRNTASRNGGVGDHSGTMAYAIRYDGP